MLLALRCASPRAFDAMSEAVSYLSEPATAGKVVLHTTIGDLDLELFSQQAPQTCRTFLHLALRRAHDGCTFHRIERDFLAQSGDLATSSLPHDRLQRVRAAEWYSEPLKPELHSRLRFNRRGLVGLARSAKPQAADGSTAAAVEDNAQFFITLAPTAELTGQHTLFGKITGSTLYNLTRLNEPDVAATNSTTKVRVTGVELLTCPWPELIGEVEEEERAWRVAEEEEARRRKKKEAESNRLAKRNVNALSFAADDEEAEPEEGQADRRKRGKGLHDVLVVDKRLPRGDEEEAVTKEAEMKQPSRPAVEEVKRDSDAQRSDDDDEDEDDKYDLQMRERVMRGKLASADNGQSTSASTSSADIKHQIQQLTKQLFPAKSAASSTSASDASNTPAVSLVEQRKQRFLQQKRQRLDDSTTSSNDTMAKLASFRSKLQHTTLTNPPPQPNSAVDSEQQKTDVDWVTASASLLRDAEDEEERKVREKERLEGAAWMRHRLQFVKRPQDYAAEEGGGEDGLVVFDPTGKEGSKEEVRMGRKGLGVEMGDGRRRGDSRERDRRRDDHSSHHSGSRSRNSRDRRR